MTQLEVTKNHPARQLKSSPKVCKGKKYAWYKYVTQNLNHLSSPELRVRDGVKMRKVWVAPQQVKGRPSIGFVEWS